MNNYADLSLDGDQPWLNVSQAFQFLLTFHSMVVTGLHEMKRIQRDLEVFTHQPDGEMKERFKTDQAYLNEVFFRLRESLREFMDSGQGIRLPS